MKKDKGFNKKGVRAASKKAHGTAIDHFEQALKLHPFYSLAQYNMVCAFAQMGDDESALEGLETLYTWDDPQVSAQLIARAVCRLDNPLAIGGDIADQQIVRYIRVPDVVQRRCVKSAVSQILVDTFVYFTVAISLGVLIFSEIIPKTAGVVYARSLARVIARPIQWLVWIFTPFIWLNLSFAYSVLSMQSRATFLSPSSPTRLMYTNALRAHNASFEHMFDVAFSRRICCSRV